MESHCRSKKHRENLAKMKATMLAEDELLNGKQEDIQADQNSIDSKICACANSFFYIYV